MVSTGLCDNPAISPEYRIKRVTEILAKGVTNGRKWSRLPTNYGILKFKFFASKMFPIATRQKFESGRSDQDVTKNNDPIDRITAMAHFDAIQPLPQSRAPVMMTHRLSAKRHDEARGYF